MSDDDAPKSAVELAMEKLRARGFEETPLSDEQKASIADTRSFYQARIAELEIQSEGKMRQATSLEELESAREELTKEKERLSREMEKKIAKLRKG